MVEYRKKGASDAVILQYCPFLKAQDLANAWAYYAAHRDEIEREIAENELAQFGGVSRLLLPVCNPTKLNE